MAVGRGGADPVRQAAGSPPTLRAVHARNTRFSSDHGRPPPTCRAAALWTVFPNRSSAPAFDTRVAIGALAGEDRLNVGLEGCLIERLGKRNRRGRGGPRGSRRRRVKGSGDFGGVGC